MKITLNTREEEIPYDIITMEELIEYKNFTFKILITKINDKLIKKDVRYISIVKDGDKVLILHQIAGG